MSLDEQLRSHGLRVTGIRRDVLDLLQRSDRALSHADVERALPERADRVTLFRVLQSFEDAGLAHRVLDVQGTSRYASCSTECDAHAHHDVHAHFRCTACSGVFCLERVALPEVNVPKGFTVTASRLELEGRCSSCA
ncbi:MAG: transcriptional repressor [Flavobacteriales bacterium]|nr:transcriptional repressor [Flavobacteriales bacterium]